MDRNLLVKALVLDAAEQWIGIADVREVVEARVRAEQPDWAEFVFATEDAVTLVAQLERDGLVVADAFDGDAPKRYLRDRRNMVEARARVLGAATNAGASSAALLDLGATLRDLEALVAHGMLTKKDDHFSLALKADDPLWQEGARAFLLRTIPPAKRGPELDELEREIWTAVASEGDWIATDPIHDKINAARDARAEAEKKKAEHLALGPLQEALVRLFNLELLESHEADNVRSWRESKDAIVDRHTRVIHALSFAFDGRSIEEISKQIGVAEAVIEADVERMADVGLVALGDRRASLRRGVDGMEAAMDRVIAAEVAHAKDPAPEQDTRVQEYIQEVASFREKHAREKRRADDLASWIMRRTGCKEQDALDEVRGVTVTAKSTREEFDWTSSRIVDAAEKGAILGEIIALDNKIAAERTHLEELTGEYKARIKGLTAQIQDLKNAAACNQRVVACRAYKRTDWERKKVVIHAADDHRVLAEEDLPHGTQRTLDSAPVTLPEQAESAAAIVARLATISDEQLADFAARAKERGWKVSIDLTKEGAERVIAVASPEEREKALAAQAAELGLALPPLPTDEAALAEAVFATTDGGTEALSFETIAEILDGRFELPAGGGAKVRAALDRLVERGALVTADGAWARPAAPTAAELPATEDVEPGPLASEEQRAEHRKRGGKRKAKSAEASAT